MKKTLILQILALSLLSSCGCSNNEPSNKVKVVSDCLLVEQSYKVTDMNVHFFNDKDIPYLEIEDTVNIWEKFTYTKLDETHAKLTNKIGVSFYINFDTTEITYDSFDFLIDEYATTEDQIFDNLSHSLFPSKKIKEESKYVKGKDYSFKLSDFGFNFEKYNNKYFAPVDVISTICFDNRSYYYEDKMLCSLPVENEEIKAKLTFNKAFNKTHYEHSFNLFMLKQEMYSGLKGITRKKLSDGTYHTFFEKGVINTLLPYKEKIINSGSIEDFDKNMMDMINTELCSGGHDNVYETSFKSEQQYLYSAEYDAVDYTAADVIKERAKSKDTNDFKEPVFAYDTDNDGKKDIGYITFDTFSDFTFKREDESTVTGMKDILVGENGANNLFNPNSKEYDSSKYDIKDVVIDLTANSGGSVSAEQALAEWLCNGKLQAAERCANTGSYNKVSYVYDTNSDGVYDEQDYLPNSINVYILTSNGSYSSGNILPFDCACYNKNNNPTNKIKFIGARTGGGCCCITGPHYLPTGFAFYMSYATAVVDYEDINHTSEDEIKIDNGLELELSQMVDRTGPNGINNLIASKRNETN